MKRYTVAIKHKLTIKAVDEEEAVAAAIEELIGLYEAGDLDEAITVKKLIASEDDSEPEEESDIWLKPAAENINHKDIQSLQNLLFEVF